MKLFYCPTCNQMKRRHQVKYEDYYSYFVYRCRYCHKETETLEKMLLRLNKEITETQYSYQLNDLHDWINKEAKSRYKGHPAEKEAFKDGIYALLDKINFKHGGKK